MATAGASTNPAKDDLVKGTYEGQLNKFTNVVKGWQYRWFVLNSDTGHLEYYLLEDRGRRSSNKCRGVQHLSGAVVVPSDEDSQTFNVNFASGDSYKLRAVDTRERQVWVDRIRAVAEKHERGPPPPHPMSNVSQFDQGEPSGELQNLSVSAVHALGSASDAVHLAQTHADDLSKEIEKLPNREHLNKDLLLLKATSHASVRTLEQAIGTLEDYRYLKDSTVRTSQHISKSVFPSGSASPKKMSANPFSLMRTPSSFSTSTHSLPSDLKPSSSKSGTKQESIS